MAWYPARSHKNTPAVSQCAGNILVLHFIISNSVVNRQLMLLYIPLIATHHNSSWQSKVKYIPLCWHYLLFFVSYKWFVALLWILVRKCISRSFYKKQHSTAQEIESLGKQEKAIWLFLTSHLCFLPFLSANVLQAALSKEIHQAAVESINPLL